MRARRKYGHAIHWAAEALVEMKDAPALDARIVAEAIEARRSRLYIRFAWLMRIGCRRGLQAAFDLAQSCLTGLDDEPEAQDTAVQCAHELEAAGRLDDAWVLAALERPETPSFAVAARLVRRRSEPAIVDALQRALESTARGGVSSAEAAEALVAMEALGTEDPRLHGILDRAPEPARGSLVGTLLFMRAPLSLYRRHFVDLLASADAEVAQIAFQDLHAKRLEGTKELFEEVLARGPNPSIHQDILRYLDKPTGEELYWCDAGDEEDDEDLDDLDDLDDDEEREGELE